MGGSHLERTASSQSFEGYLVDRGKEDVPACSLKTHFISLLVLAVSSACIVDAIPFICVFNVF